MPNVNALAVILTATFLPIVAHAKIFSDQLVIDQLENQQCRAGYRPLTHQEALEHQQAIVSRMQTWEIIGLDGGWAMMGSGYHGQIKPEQSSDKIWCYPTQPNAELSSYMPTSILPGTSSEIEHNLVTNQAYFIRPISYLAHSLGYAWLSGNANSFVGEDMIVNKTNNRWVIQGNNSGTCEGDRCNEKTKITVSDFAYHLNPDHFWHGDVTESMNEQIKSVTAYAINKKDTPQKINVQFSVEQSTTWSKLDDSALAQNVDISTPFQWPKVTNNHPNFWIEANQKFSELPMGNSTSSTIREANLTVPAHSILPIRIELYRSRISYPYRFRADISYRINFNGFLRHTGNAWHSHPKDRPTISHNFTVGRISELSENIRYQWDHRYIPGETKWWDWSWAIHNHSLTLMQYAAGASLRPYYSHISGLFDAESQYVGMIDVGRELVIHAPLEWSEEANLSQFHAGDITIVTDFDSSVLDRLGFHSARLLVHPIN